MKYEFDHTLPIVMWDFSWLELHHRGGHFEDWDAVIDWLVECGYEAVRIDVFPHLIASDGDGIIRDTFHFDHGGAIGSALWGRRYSVELEVRRSTVEFIHKLQPRGIKIGLSSWIRAVRENRHAQIGDVYDFVRIWDETLTFLSENDCLGNVIYVDLLNEFPLWHDYTHFQKEYASYPDSSPEQDAFYWGFAGTALSLMHEKWPDLRIFFSQTENHFTYRDLHKDYTQFDALDVHMWMTHNPELAEHVQYLGESHTMSTDVHFPECNQSLHDYYFGNLELCHQWMKEHIEQAASLSQKYHIPVGNTEGWGIINWCEHPYLEWDMIKHAGLVSAKLASDAGFSFICSCNFCHPQFPGVWNDLAWHKQITEIIRRGKPCY